MLEWARREGGRRSPDISSFAARVRISGNVGCGEDAWEMTPHDLPGEVTTDETFDVFELSEPTGRNFSTED